MMLKKTCHVGMLSQNPGAGLYLARERPGIWWSPGVLEPFSQIPIPSGNEGSEGFAKSSPSGSGEAAIQISVDR
jgi:hypothetical protein